jgi:hypothetical protein
VLNLTYCRISLSQLHDLVNDVTVLSLIICVASPAMYVYVCVARRVCFFRCLSAPRALRLLPCCCPSACPPAYACLPACLPHSRLAPHASRLPHGSKQASTGHLAFAHQPLILILSSTVNPSSISSSSFLDAGSSSELRPQSSTSLAELLETVPSHCHSRRIVRPIVSPTPSYANATSNTSGTSLRPALADQSWLL